VVGAAVHHHDVGGQRRGQPAAGAVRQGEEHHVVPGQRLPRGGFEHPVGQGGQVRLVLPQPGPGAGGGAERADLHLGVPEQYPQQLPAGVAAGPGHRHPHTHSA
jgi:hypothetical protein